MKNTHFGVFSSLDFSYNFETKNEIFMKKQLLFLMLIAGCMLAFTGCKKDDEVKAGDLQGRWDLVSENYKLYVNGQVRDQDNDEYEIGESYIIFDGNTASTYDNGDLDFVETFTISGDKLIFTFEGETHEVTVKWNNNDQVVITDRDDDGENTYEISESVYNRHK